MTRLRQKLHSHLPFSLIFEAPTVREMATAIELIFIEEVESLDEEEIQRLVGSLPAPDNLPTGAVAMAMNPPGARLSG